MTSQIKLYTSPDGQVQLDIKVTGDNIWLTQAQISRLFATTSDNVSLHLKNIYADQELSERATTEDSSTVRKEGKRQVKRQLKHYNLDAIISVGYRVNSSRATQFRIWANRILKQHLIQGFSLNEKRLQEQGYEFEQAIDLLSRTLKNQHLIDPTGMNVLSVISNYVRSWSLILGYDEASLAEIRHPQQPEQIRHSATTTRYRQLIL